MKKIFLTLLCALFLTSCGKDTNNYTISYKDNNLTLYDNDIELMQLSGKDTTWEKKTIISRNNVDVYFDGRYLNGFEHLYGNERRLEPLYIQQTDKLYYVYENDDGIMYFCCADTAVKESTVLYTEEISDNDEIYDIKADDEEISFIHTIYNNGEPYKNIIKTTIGTTYAVVDFYQ